MVEPDAAAGSIEFPAHNRENKNQECQLDARRESFQHGTRAYITACGNQRDKDFPISASQRSR